MLCGVWTRVGLRNHVLDGVQISPHDGAILRGEMVVHCKVWGLPVISCAKTAVSIEMRFRILSQIGPQNHVLDECTLAQPGEYD